MALSVDNKKEMTVVNKEEIKNAIESGDSNAFAETVAKNIVANNEALMQSLVAEAKTFNVHTADAGVLASRGFRALTAEEAKYYNAVQDAHSFEGLQLPATVFDRVFEDLRKDHPLLSKIRFQNVTGVTEWVIRVGDVENAWWGKLCEDIRKKLDVGFDIISTTLHKVSAYVPVCKAMLDLGPAWLDRFVREILAESVAGAIEEAIVAGDGVDKPVGMIYQLANVVDGAHTMKTPVALTNLSPATIGTQILAPLSSGTKAGGEVLLLVNPNTYYAKLYSMFVTQDEYGQYRQQNLPFNGTIIESAYVPEDRLVVGYAKNYFMGVGSSLKIEYSDEFRFLDDQRVYITKQYANGRPRQDEDFLFFDISGFGADAPTGV